MARLPEAFQPAGHEQMNNYAPIPAGDYLMKIVKSDFKATKNNDGHYLSLEFEVVSGKMKGRKLFRNLNLINRNETAVRIANSEFATICAACDYKDPVSDSVVLHDKPMVVTIVVQPASANQPERNNVKYYRVPTAEDIEKLSVGTPLGMPSGNVEQNTAVEVPPKKSIWS